MQSGNALGKEGKKFVFDRAWLEKDLGKYPAKLHAHRVAHELGVNRGIIYLPGQDSKYYDDSDMGPRFRQRRHFYYVSGADFPGCVVTYDIARDHLVLWIPHVEPRTVLYFGRLPGIEECKAASDLDDVRPIEGLDKALADLLKDGDTLYTLHSDQVPKVAEGAPVYVDTSSLLRAADNARVVKTEYEVEVIRRANHISSEAHRALLSRLSTFTNEREIDAQFIASCTAHGAPTQSYPLIVASGINASILHYDENNQTLTDGRQFLVIDGGAEFRCYASDITRTLPLYPSPSSSSSSSSPFPSPKAEAIYRLVERMQEECIERVRPGVLYVSLHRHAAEVAVDGLLKLGLLKAESAAEVLAQGTVAAFFPHGLGHHIGLEVHDVAGDERLYMSVAGSSTARGAGRRGRGKREYVPPTAMAALFSDHDDPTVTATTTTTPAADKKPYQALRPNMILTIEPGIYFCREYIEGNFLSNPSHARFIDRDVLDTYWDVGGVRIEDDILVTKDGYENLTAAPKGDAMLEEIARGRRVGE
ncbi:peptidase M24, structural domain-containing protein [Dichotomopilus funicola]|uniref:Xaa-Pro aminopeptidase n=1 Tax=Dichotomopilus funicola TaxID=1934379 RepID=A0AAN6ZPN1_9PEZI|nr:peptidase M24, structural domain-containing protein [Dichotomopilus funicola]